MRPQSKRVADFSLTLFCLLLVSCHGSSSSNGSGANSPTPSAPAADASTQAQAPPVDPCSRFSAADAQSITGVSMKLVPGHGANVCMYDEAAPKSAVDTARVSLMLNVRRSPEEESRAWNNVKVIRRLRPGEKNVTRLDGIGDEAWFDGALQKGKTGVGGVVARKGRTDFMLDSATFGYRASAEQMKNVARKVAEGLP